MLATALAIIRILAEFFPANKAIAGISDKIDRIVNTEAVCPNNSTRIKLGNSNNNETAIWIAPKTVTPNGLEVTKLSGNSRLGTFSITDGFAERSNPVTFLNLYRKAASRSSKSFG